MENIMASDPEEFDGDEGGDEDTNLPLPEPGKYLITEDELRSLAEGVEVPGLDATEVLANAQAILLRLTPCRFISKATGEPHERPQVDIEWSVTDQVMIGRALLIVENLRKFNMGGYVPGVVYRGLTKKGELREVVRDSGGFSIDDLTHTDIVAALEMAACWVKVMANGDIKHAEPKGSVKSQVSARHIPYPPLKAVVQAPRWSFDGKTYNVAHTIGYDAATACFIGRDFKITRKTKPTDKDVAAALGVIEDLIGEFPYADEASRRNAYALALTLPLRNLATTAPMFPISAFDPGSGKTLLAETLVAACFGVIPTPKKMAYNEGEQERRNITAVLRDTTTDMDVVWFDEPRKSSQTTEIVSDTLNLIATAAAGQYVDRPIMQRMSLTLNVVLTWILTGNNLALNSELQRRTVRIELQRNGNSFSRTEDELREHAIASQERFHQAVATLIDNWVAKGCPQPTHTPQFPSFNAWLTIVGGILEAAGIEGLRQNPDTAGPYTAARAEWLEWIRSSVAGNTTGGDKDIDQQAIVQMLNGGTQAKRKAAMVRLEKLVHFATPKDAAEWDKLVEKVRTGGVKSNGLSRVMKLCLVQQTWDFGDGRSISVKRLEEGGGLPVRYRLSLMKKSLDRRAGQNLPKRRRVARTA